MVKDSKILLLEEDQAVCKSIFSSFKNHDLSVYMADTGKEWSSALRSMPVDLAIVGLPMSGQDSFELLKEIKLHRPLCQVILLVDRISLSELLGLFESGVIDFFLKSAFKEEDLLSASVTALRKAGRWRQSMLQQQAKEGIQS